jgi:lysyl-tRNA synthetase class 2
MTRSEFLTKFWQAYPAMPPDADMAGRVLSCRNGKVELLNKGSWKIAKDCRFPVEILNANDLVAFELKAGEISNLTLLAPALEEPLQLSSDSLIQDKWFHFLSQVRLFFAGKGFNEAQTPTLVTCPGTEPFLDLFSTRFQQGSRSQTFYLPTSPELHLKKMLSVGYEQIFEIRPCFRNGEITERHQPEFWMLEWYRAFSNLEQILQDTLHLIDFLGGNVEGFGRKSMADLFQETLNFKLTPQTTLQELKTLAQAQGLKAENFEIWDDVFYLIFVEKVEPFLESEQPLIVEKYPPSQAALARLTEDGWGERFELYWKGLEICNAFHELNDPVLQAERFEADLAQKAHLGKEVPPLDPDFIRALRSGMPPSGGIALGLERLFMALNGIKSIQELRVFPARNLK